MRQREAGDQAKLIIFCIAYTLYSVRKKDDINKAIEKSGVDSPEIARAFEKYREEWLIDSLIAEGDLILKESLWDVRERSMAALLTHLENEDWISTRNIYRKTMDHLIPAFILAAVFFLLWNLPTFISFFMKEITHS